MYNHYKPLRNLTEKLHLTKSLVDIWQLYQNIERDIAIPQEFAALNNGIASLKGIVHPWELDILTREIILNAGSAERKNLLKKSDLAAAINIIRKLADNQSAQDLEKTIFQEMHRIIQQQFPWQRNSTLSLCRYLCIYSDPDVEAILKKNTGISAFQFYFLGMALLAAFYRKPFYDPQQSFKEFGISDKQRNMFLNRITIDLKTLRQRTKDVQEYNENWSYTINPLLKTPLIMANINGKILLSCPIPSYLLKRFSEGLFFDIAEAADFSEPYGKAFEKYIGYVANILVDNTKLSIEKPETYFVKRQKKEGADWYIYDDSSALIIECKTKGLKLKARYEINESALNDEISILAKSIVQTYKNINDIKLNLTNWEHKGRNLYPITVTLADWFLFAPKNFETLENSVKEQLTLAKIPISIIQESPYTVMSAQEFETMIQIINKVGLEEFVKKKNDTPYKDWMTIPTIRFNYEEELNNCRYDYLNEKLDNFRQSFEEMLPLSSRSKSENS